MAPVRTENDQCKPVAFLSITKCLLHIGQGICGWLKQLAIRVGLSGTGTTSNEARAHDERGYG
jgi:hypothetical protein